METLKAVDEDLVLFNQLILDETPDCEVGETLFGYTCGRFNLTIVKVSEVMMGIKMSALYHLSINGALNMTRFIRHKDNVIAKTYLVINEYFGAKTKEELEYEYQSEKEIFTGSRYTTAEYEY